MPLTNINSDWISNASSGLRIIVCYILHPKMQLKDPRNINKGYLAGQCAVAKFKAFSFLVN